MDGDRTDEGEAQDVEINSDSESENSQTRARGRSRGQSRGQTRGQSRGRSRVRRRGASRSSSDSEAEPQHESTSKSMDKSRVRSRSMSRPPSMERLPVFFEPRSQSLDRAHFPTRNQSLGRYDSPRRNHSPRKYDSPRRNQSLGRYEFPRRNHSPDKDFKFLIDCFLEKRKLNRNCSCSEDTSGGIHRCHQCNQSETLSDTSFSAYRQSLEVKHESGSEEFVTEASTKTEHEGDFNESRWCAQKPVRVVLTHGEVGMGKTVSVQNFTLDWARGLEHQDLDLVIVLSFRELNLLREGHLSLLELIKMKHPSLEGLTAEELEQKKVMFIFDGLDDSRLPLNFSCEVISEVTQRSEVTALLANLIKGHLLPDALIWITSRPAAASQIPVQYVDKITTISGFTSDHQREQFFKTRFSDEEQCEKVLSFLKESHTLWSMCQSPLFCSTTATVLKHRLQLKQSQLPSLTELFIQFLLMQMHLKKRKYDHVKDLQLRVTQHELLLKLGRLAFKLLQEGSLLFDHEDLQKEGLAGALIYSGICTEVFEQHSVIFNQSFCSFVHPSVQMFLAAVYMHHCLNKQSTEELTTFKQQSQNTLLKLFLHELSLKVNHRLLRALLGLTATNS